jgi:PAS domain S-box-containing protein
MQTQAELHAFNEQMMCHSLDVLCAVGANGRFLRVSQSVNTILGYGPDEMQGRPVFEFIVDDDHAASLALTNALKDGSVTRDFRNRYRHRNGRQVDMMWSAAWDATSETLFCVGRDITAMVEEERFAEDQRAVLAMISASQPLPSILDTLCHMIERCLPGCRASIAMVQHDSATMTVLSAPSLPPLYRETVNGIALAEGSCACATAAYRGEALFIEDVAESALWTNYREAALAEGLRSCWCMPMMSQDNTVLGTLSLYSSELAVAGGDEHVMLVCTQLAALALEREQDQVQLKTSEQRYRSLFTHNPDAVYSFDLTGAFTSMNDAGYALIGMKPEGLLGTHFNTLVDRRDLADLSASFTRSLGGEPVRYEARVHSARGEVLELDISNLPMVVDGEVVGIFGIAKDLRGIKEAQRELERQLGFTQTMTNSLQDGLIATDAQGLINFANPAAQTLLNHQLGTEAVHLSQWTPLDPVHWAAGPDTGLAGEFEQRQAAGTLRIAYHAVRLRSADNDAGWVVTFRDRTAEIKAGQALAERDQFFNLSLDMFCMISLKGLFVQLNPAMIQALGYREAEIVDQPYPRFLVPADRAKAEAAMNKLAQGQGVADLDLRVCTADGRVTMLQLNAALGEDRIVYVVARDVTEQRAVNTVIEQHHALFQIAGSIARIGGWMIDLQSNKIILSDEVCAIHQLPAGSVIDLERVVDLYVPECHRELRSKLKKCMQQGESYELRCEALNASGERIWVRLTGKALRNQDGQITRIQGAVQDISDIMRAENELHRLATRMQNILTSITDAFFSLDGDWRFTYVNQQAETLLERNADELLGGDVWKIFPEALGSEIYPRYIEVVATKQKQHFEVYYQELQRWFEISAYPFEDGLSVFFRDISERKQGEERLSAAIAELERSNRELQDFAFIASHDLQEPLRKVQAFGERLEQRSTQLDETGRDYLQRMRQASGRMQNLIQDLLMYSRVATRGGNLLPVPLDSVLDAVLVDMETAIENVGGTIERQPLASVQGDTRQLGQALQNLLSNALKFHRKEVLPLIRVYGETAEDGSWTLCVTDNGIGFDEKYLNRIFNPFQRLHDRQQFSGTGIGLAIVRKIAERHQAAITARSEPGAGSTFRITFPPASVFPDGGHRTTDRRTVS